MVRITRWKGEIMLLVDAINTYYGEAHTLFDVTLELQEGETVALLGRNGAGKTTTLRSIMGLTPPRSGGVRLNGRDMSGMPTFEIARAGIGFVPEDRRVFPTLTVQQNLDMGKGARKDGYWNLQRIFEHFPKLYDLRHRKGEYLSGGEQQMLAIARTLMGNPDLVLLDEPTEGLAPIIAQEIVKIIRVLKQNRITVLLVEQNSTMALSLADRCYVLDDGRVVYQGSPDTLEQDKALRQKLLGI